MRSRDPLEQLESGPVFVVGWVRSGTTWVYDALTAHPRVGGVLESWMFTKTYGVQGPLKDFHWKPDPAGTAQGLGRITTRERAFAELRKLTSGWLAAGLEPGDRFLVEKSPSHLFAMPLIAELYPDARFVHIVRDARDVAVSVRAASATWAPAWGSGFASSLRGSAQAWNRAALEGCRNAAALGERCLQIRYEDLRARPREHFARIFEHCRIPLAEGGLDEIVTATEFRRDPGGRSAHRRKAEPGEWRRELAPWEALAVTAIARDGLEAAGYPSGRLAALRR